MDTETVESLIKFYTEQVLALKVEIAEYKMNKEKNPHILLPEKLHIEGLRQEVDKLKIELEEVKNRINEITKARVKKRNKNEADLMEKFFRDYIVAENGSKVKTVDVMKKMNESVADKNIRYNQFEVAKFIKDKGIIKKKTGGYDYYLNIRFCKI